MAEEKHSIIIAGGGTGGHVLAGVAVAESWKKRFPDAPILFVGAAGGIEEKLVPRAGYPLELLHLGSLNGVSYARKLKTLAQLPLALWKSAYILLRQKPDAVLGVGGYASGPLLLMARLLSMFRVLPGRTAILEQNSVPGFTNRLLGRLVETVFCAFPGTEGRFERSRPVLTGNPIRSAMKRLPSAPRDPFTIFIFGGSQGAMGINSLVLETLPLLKDLGLGERVRFIHQTGERDHARVVEGYAAAGVPARIEKFIHDMPQAYAQASLLICRAGSSTLAEIAAVGRAAILVPFPYASDNHQQKNAEVFAGANAARLLVQGRAKGEDLAAQIRDFVRNPAALDDMEKAVTAFYRPDAAQDIVHDLTRDLAAPR